MDYLLSSGAIPIDWLAWINLVFCFAALFFYFIFPSANFFEEFFLRIPIFIILFFSQTNLYQCILHITASRFQECLTAYLPQAIFLDIDRLVGINSVSYFAFLVPSFHFSFCKFFQRNI